MSVTPVSFVVRGDKWDARYGVNGLKSYTYSPNGPTAPLTVVTTGFTGEIGGSSLALIASGNGRAVWPGYLNIPQPGNGGVSILYRASFPAVSGNYGLLNFGAAGLAGPYTLFFWVTGSVIQVNILGSNTASGLNSTITHGMSINTIYDIVLTWDYTTTSNNVKLYLNATLLTSFSSTQAWSTAFAQPQPCISSGGVGGVGSGSNINEIAVFPGVINVNSVWCGGAQVALNGNARSAFVDCNAFDGTLYTYPAASDIRFGVASLVNAGLAVTPTCVVPTGANTKHGVSVDVSATGSYRGADLYDIVAAADLKHGVTKMQDGSSVVGVYTAADLWDAVAADALKHGLTKNQNGSSVLGTYRGYDLFDDVVANELKHGVILNVDGSPVTGTYTGSDVNDAIDPAELKHGVSKANLGSTVVGTYRGADLWEALTSDQVLIGIVKLQDGVSVTGVLQANTPPTPRGACDKILNFIGASSLTDDEWATMDVDETTTPEEIYEQLLAVLLSRETVSDLPERLTDYFNAKGIDVSIDPEVIPPAADSDILIGGDLAVAPALDGKSNLLLGGEL